MPREIMGTIMRGTTPTHEFVIPFNTDMIAALRISYAQDDKEIIVKREGECSLASKTVSVTLTQEETFKLDCKKQVEVQIRILTKGGEALENDIIYLGVGKCLNNEVLTYEA